MRQGRAWEAATQRPPTADRTRRSPAESPTADRLFNAAASRAFVTGRPTTPIRARLLQNHFSTTVNSHGREPSRPTTLEQPLVADSRYTTRHMTTNSHLIAVKNRSEGRTSASGAAGMSSWSRMDVLTRRPSSAIARDAASNPVESALVGVADVTDDGEEEAFRKTGGTDVCSNMIK